jgi:hypothetical protein
MASKSNELIFQTDIINRMIANAWQVGALDIYNGVPLCQDRCRLSLRDFVLSSGAKESDRNYEHQVFQRVQG